MDLLFEPKYLKNKKKKSFEDNIRMSCYNMFYEYLENEEFERILDTKFTDAYLKKIARKIISNEIICSISFLDKNKKKINLEKIRYIFQPYYMIWYYGYDKFKNLRMVVDEKKREELYTKIALVYEYKKNAQFIDSMFLDLLFPKESSKLRKKYKNIETFNSFIPLNFENSKRLVIFLKEEYLKNNGKI